MRLKNYQKQHGTVLSKTLKKLARRYSAWCSLKARSTLLDSDGSSAVHIALNSPSIAASTERPSHDERLTRHQNSGYRITRAKLYRFVFEGLHAGEVHLSPFAQTPEFWWKSR